MEKITLIAPCHFGLEAVLKREIQDLGYEITKTEDGKVYFTGDVSAVARANIFLRTAERILWQVAEFDARDFETLFTKTYDIPWEQYIPADGKVWVTKANSIKSQLSATVPVQSVMKKAMAKRLGEVYHTEVLPETGAEYPVRVTLMKNHVTVAMDTTGEALHKRGYRQLTSKAPIEETLAAALIMLTPWRSERILLDPFCGSGTFAIEAALMGAGIAPGIHREFTAETWKNLVPRKAWYAAAEEADRMQDAAHPEQLQIYASDIDPKVLNLAKKNAELAGVKEYIHFSCQPVKNMAPQGEYGFIITNPPYGQRLEDVETAKTIYEEFAENFRKLRTWSAYVITPIEETEQLTGRRADKKRKVYNGMMKTDYYAFCGPRPDKDMVFAPPERPVVAEKEKKPGKPPVHPVKKVETETPAKPKSKHIQVTKGKKFTMAGKINQNKE